MSDDANTVLLVDDNADVRSIGELLLLSLGYNVLMAATAESALAILKSNDRVDLLLTDVVISTKMNGYELATTAKQLRPTLKVLMTSGFPEQTTDGLVAYSFLPKPFSKASLHRAIQTTLNSDH